jgi:transposase-like protein
MANAKTWRERVGEWRASGLSAVKFAEGRGFSPHQLWYWRAKFRQQMDQSAAHTTSVASPALATTARVPLARVVRRPNPELAPVATKALLSVEIMGVHIAVPPGFDRATFAAVLDEIEARKVRAGGR